VATRLTCHHFSIFSVLLSADVDTEVIRYLHAKQVMTIITQSWKGYYGIVASQPPPWEHIEIELELIIHYLEVGYSKVVHLASFIN
jgi:hypothetical protein